MNIAGLETVHTMFGMSQRLTKVQSAWNEKRHVQFQISSVRAPDRKRSPLLRTRQAAFFRQ